jgi:hypothetical protein
LVAPLKLVKPKLRSATKDNLLVIGTSSLLKMLVVSRLSRLTLALERSAHRKIWHFFTISKRKREVSTHKLRLIITIPALSLLSENRA